MMNDSASNQKTLEQRVRESECLSEIEKRRAKERQLATQNNRAGRAIQRNLIEQDQEKGQSRDCIAKMIGIGSGKSYENAVKVVRRIDEETAAENYDTVNALRYKLNHKSINAAIQLLKSLDRKVKIYHKNEKDLEKAITEQLRSQGIKCETAVHCSVGVADIVTEEAVIEVKHLVKRESLFKAIGQVLLYREAINTNLKAKIVCTSYDINELREMVELAKQIEVEVIFWEICSIMS